MVAAGHSAASRRAGQTSRGIELAAQVKVLLLLQAGIGTKVTAVTTCMARSPYL